MSAILPAWHAWYAQADAYSRLAEQLGRTLAWDPERERVDRVRLARGGATDYLTAIRAEILAQALPLDRAIAAAVAAIDAQDGAALKASRSGRGEPPPDRTAARDALLRLRAHMVAHPDDVTLPPASVPLHPTLASLSAMAQRLAATPAPLPDPATWRPTEPAHDPVADARAAAQTAATSATTEDPASRPFAVPATTVGASPGPAVSPASQSSPSPSSPASSDAAPDTPTIAPAALPPALAAVHAARQAWDAADQRAPAGDHIPEDSAERQAQHAARRAGHTDADIAAAALNIPLAAYSIAAGLPAWGGRPGLLLPAEDNNDLVALQQAILSHRAADRAAAFADDRTAARYKLEGAQRAENRAWARAHLAGHSEAVIRAAVAAITHPSQRRPAEPLDTDALSAAGTMPPLDAMADDAPSAHTQGIDDDARAMPSFDDEDRPPTEDEIALDLARRLTQDDAAADMVRDIDDLLITTDHEDDAIMDTLTPSPLSAADILVAGQREAADRAAELQAASTAATRARADSDARRLRAEDAHNRREGIASDTTVRPPKTTASGPGKDTALGEEFGVDHAPEKQRHAFLKDLGEFYRTHFAAKHEQEIAHVRIRPGQYADDVKVEFRDGSYIRDDGRSIMLDSKGTPQKAELLIEIAAAKGMSSVRLKGSREFKMDLAKACYEHGIEVLNPELQDYMRLLADRFPERAGIHARESNFEDPHAATNQRATTPPDNPPPAADPSPTSPAPSGPLPSPASATATPEAGPGAATPTLATDPLAKRLIDLTAARVARAEASLAALSASLDQPAVDAATEALAAARAALTKAERIAAIRAGTLHDDPIITAALAEDDALRLWIADEVTLATDRANATPPATAPRIARSHPLATLAVALADEGVTRAAAVLSDAEDAGPTQAAVDAARADLARATNARDTIREIATTSPAAALLAATRTVIDAEIATLAPLVTSANDDTEARRIDALRGVTDADILTAAAAMTNPPEAALGKSLAATLSDAALAAAHERWSQDDAAAPTTPPVPESTSATPQTGTDPLPPDPQVIASLVSANLQDIDRTAFTSMSWSDFSDERRDTESSAWDLQTAIVDALRANGLPATDASVQATYEAFRAPADQTPPITAPQPTAASPVGDADAAAQSAISVASSPALMPPDPVADLHSALATLATPQAPEVVRAHAAMSAAEARTQIEAALFAAQTDAAITAATPPALARLDATLLEAFDTVAIGRQWLSMTAARYGNAPAALTAALRFDPNGAINGVAEPETTAFLSRLADTIDADPAALQAQQPPALDPAGVAREERIASLSIALAEAPGHDALRTAELKHLATVDLDYGIHDAPTEAYAARVTPVVAALQATSLLDWTIDAHLPGYRDAGLARQTLLANGLPFLDGPARADIQAAAEAAGRANRALLAADSTITPDHLRQGADQRIATADGIVAALIMAPAPLPRPTDPTAVAIHATARAFLAAATSAQRALAAATLLDLLVETRPTVASLETSLLAPLAAAEREERNAASDLKFRAVNLRDAVTALYADPAAVLAALDATPAAARAAWIATPPAVADLGPRLTVDETAPHADHHASQFAEAHAIFPDAVRACAQASVAHAAAAHAATQARAAVAETPNAPAAQEIRAAIRDAIPWSSLPSASGTTTSDVRLSVVGTTTDLDAAAAVLYHAAAPASHSLSAADLARDPTLSPADRDTLVTWLHLDDTLSQASEAQTAARSPTAAPAVRLQALTTAENAILEVAIATQQLGATPTNRAFHVALGDFQAAAHALAHQAARLIQADPASLQHALAHGAEYSLTTHRAPDAPPQSDHRSPEHDQAADAVEPEMA
ncbi:LPD7 domain-containing protein [Azospirillum canadense]|uniref:LPD7 domain-containing protein n=1 Tax=Azospirillum canadense TaxID=403962 RepID=UPI002226BF1B|nr:LPD7 domain-containing protein [Azospirillum canadense]MCW2240756.1 hypothetical protein [Azospirillum canadense]